MLRSVSFLIRILLCTSCTTTGDYVQHAGDKCEVITTPGCEGMPDGPNPYPNRLLTSFYLMCQANKTVSTMNCVEGQVFDPIKLVCTKEVDKCKYCVRL